VTARPRHLSELAGRLRPDLHVISVSELDPPLARFNVVAEVDSTEAARAVVVELENLLDTEDGIGVVLMSAARDDDGEPSVEPQTKDVTFVTYHTDDESMAETVRSRLGAEDDVRLLDVCDLGLGVSDPTDRASGR
jgi:hypothetical protein